MKAYLKAPVLDDAQNVIDFLNTVTLSPDILFLLPGNKMKILHQISLLYP